MKSKNIAPGFYEKIKLKLKAADCRHLQQLLKSGRDSVRVFKRARALQLLHDGKSAPKAAEAAGISEETVRRVARRYAVGRLTRALYELPRPGSEPMLDQKQEARIVAIVCARPPDGFARWTLPLLTKEVIDRGIIDKISDETIRRLLHRHQLKPWREKNVVRRKPG